MPRIFPLADGAQLGFEVLGEQHLANMITPLVLINGMSLRYEDWDIISRPLSEKRPVLVFDHRDIGSSIIKTSPREHLTVSLMASDAISLIKSLGWTKVDILGYSMGGSILQQILTSPFLPFTVPHAILAATTTKAPRGDAEFVSLLRSLPSRPRPPRPTGPDGHPRSYTSEEKLKMMTDMVRPLAEMGYDVDWLNLPENRAFVERKLPLIITGRPAVVVAQQGLAIRSDEVDHRPSLHLIPTTTRILVIHGTRDRMIHYSESVHILAGIKHAKRVPVSLDPYTRKRGALPATDYGHTWYDYYTPDVWVDILEYFLNDVEKETAKL